MNALNANSLVVSTMAACVGYGCMHRDDKKKQIVRRPYGAT